MNSARIASLERLGDFLQRWITCDSRKNGNEIKMKDKTNITIKDRSLWERAKRHAKQNGTTLSDLIFDGLKAIMPEDETFVPFKTNLDIQDNETWK